MAVNSKQDRNCLTLSRHEFQEPFGIFNKQSVYLLLVHRFDSHKRYEIIQNVRISISAISGQAAFDAIVVGYQDPVDISLPDHLGDIVDSLYSYARSGRGLPRGSD